VQTGWNRHLETITSAARKSGPYLALEIVMPGGTLLALLLFLYQRRQAQTGVPPLVELRRMLAPRLQAASDALRRMASARVVV